MRKPASPVSTLSRRRAAASLALGVFGIGWSAILVRWSGVSGLVSAFYRLAFAALIFVPWRVFAPRRTTTATREAVRAAIIAGVLFAADLAFFNSAVMATSAANAALLGVNAPIFVALGGWVLHRERPTGRFWGGFLLALAGMIAIVGTDVLVHPALGVGDLLAVAGAFCYGIYLVYVQRGRAGMDTLSFSAWSTGVGALVPAPGLPLREAAARRLQWTLMGRARRVGARVAGDGAAARGARPRKTPGDALVDRTPGPGAAHGPSRRPLLGERIRPGQVVGGALVLAGIAVVSLERFAPRLTPRRIAA